jgi:uncharacterized oxidoreductase
MTLDLSRSTAVITGGARGIGLELTRQLVVRGGRVIAIGRNREQLLALQAENPAAITFRTVDLSAPREVDRLVADLAANEQDINILINNAGVQYEMDLFAPERGEVSALARREISTNLDSLVALTLGSVANHRKA